MHGVEGEQAIRQMQVRDQSLRNRDFVGFVVNVDMRQDDPAVGREDAQDLRRLLVLQGVKAAPQGLAVDREQRQTIRAGAGQPLRMQAERLLHLGRVETGQDISDLRVAWRLEHLRREKHAQPAKMRHDELVHLTIGGRPGQHRQQTEHQDLRQRIQFSLCAPAVSDARKNLQQCRLRQSGPS